MRLAVLVLASGCATHVYKARPSELARNASAFAERGEATVFGEYDQPVRVSAAQQVDVRIDEGRGLQRPATLPIRELVAGCTGDVSSPQCLATKAIDEPIVVRREREVDGGRAASAVGIAGLGGVIGFCIVSCQGDDLERGLAYGGGAVLGLFALAAVLFSLGGD